MRKGTPRLASVHSEVGVENPAPGVAVAVFSGEHDLATKDAVVDLLDSLLGSNDLVVADFTEAKFIDAAILGVLFDAHERAAEQGATLRLQIGTPTIVRRAFEVSGVLDAIEHHRTREQALSGKTPV